MRKYNKLSGIKDKLYNSYSNAINIIKNSRSYIPSFNGITIGALCLALGFGSGYCTYKGSEQKKTEQVKYSDINFNEIGNAVKLSAQEPVKINDNKKTKIKKPKINIVNNYFPARNETHRNPVNIRPHQSKKPHINKNRLIYTPISSGPVHKPTYTEPVHIPSPSLTTQTQPLPQITLERKVEGRKDGYNLVAYYYPEGLHNRPNEKLNVKIYGGDDVGDDFLTINIPSLGTPTANQVLKIKLDDNTEYFTEISHIFLKDIKGNDINLEEYLNIKYGKLNDTNLNSIDISPRIGASAFLKSGTKLVIETKVKNKYGTIENETLEVIINGNQ